MQKLVWLSFRMKSNHQVLALRQKITQITAPEHRTIHLEVRQMVNAIAFHLPNSIEMALAGSGSCSNFDPTSSQHALRATTKQPTRNYGLFRLMAALKLLMNNCAASDGR